MSEPVVHVIDDDDGMRSSLCFLLQTAGMEAHSYGSAPAFLKVADALGPCCIIADVRMPEMNGLELVRALNDRGVRHPVIIITGHGDVPLAVEAMKAGVIDFFEKPFDDGALLEAVVAALERDERSGADEVLRQAMLERLTSLSAREQDVLRGVVAGKANKVIAHDLGISPRTVEVYRANLMAKTDARSVSDLVRMTLLTGF